MTHIDFLYENSSLIQTIYTQEMLKKGYLVGSNVYTTFAYNDEVITSFIAESSQVFKTIRKLLDSGKLENFLDNQVKHSGFNRLT